MTAPNDRNSIKWVAIQLTLDGSQPEVRGAVLDPDGVHAMPATRGFERHGALHARHEPRQSSPPPYPETQRCPVLDGCPSMVPARSTVDNIGVAIRYRHQWVTPLNAIYDFFGGGNFGWDLHATQHLPHGAQT